MPGSVVDTRRYHSRYRFDRLGVRTADRAKDGDAVKWPELGGRGDELLANITDFSARVAAGQGRLQVRQDEPGRAGNDLRSPR